MKIYSLIGLLIGSCFVGNALYAKKVSLSGFRKTYKSTKAYKPKTIHAGFGKKSSITGKIKTKAVSGYFKKSNGYKFVNSYSKSY